jgi:hypothetical protein
MKKLLSIALFLVFCIGFTACSSTATNTANNSTNKSKVYKQGEEAFILNASGKQIYSIKINSVKVSADFLTEYNKDVLTEANKKQILEVDYTYKNIAFTVDNKTAAAESRLEITGQDLLLSDFPGTVAQYASFYSKLEPQEIPIGVKCNVQAYYVLANVSNTVKISFNSDSHPKNGTITFEIPVTVSN